METQDANIQAAIGLGQLERVDELIEATHRVFRWCAEELNIDTFHKMVNELT